MNTPVDFETDAPGTLKGGLPYTFGYELTALIHDYEECEGLGCSTTASAHKTIRIAQKIGRAVFKKFYRKSWSHHQTWFDGHCMEFPSPVFKTRGGALRFYRRMKRQFDKHRCTAHNELTVCGGNHLHFGIPDLGLIQKIFRDFYRRPEITWTFTQPDDTDSCNNIRVDRYLTRQREALRKLPWEGTPLEAALRNSGVTTSLCAAHRAGFTKGYALKKSDLTWLQTKEWGIGVRTAPTIATTVEFRGVEAPCDESEFTDQMDFFFAYVAYVKSQPMAKPLTVLKNSTFQRISARTARTNFYALCKQLGLDPKRYQKYVKRNLEPRWGTGRKRC